MLLLFLHSRGGKAPATAFSLRWFPPHLYDVPRDKSVIPNDGPVGTRAAIAAYAERDLMYSHGLPAWRKPVTGSNARQASPTFSLGAQLGDPGRPFSRHLLRGSKGM